MYRFSFIILLIFNFKATISAQLSNRELPHYNYQKGATHTGITTSIGHSLGINAIETINGSGSLKNSFSPQLLIGLYHQYHFTAPFFIRIGVDFGLNRAGYKFEQYATKSDTIWPVFDGTGEIIRNRISIPIIKFNLGFGRRFALNEHRYLEAYLGASFEKYLSSCLDDLGTTHTTTTTLSNRDRVKYSVTEILYWGDGSRWGSYNGEFQLMYRTKSYNALSDRLAIGIFATYTLDPSTVAVARLVYNNDTYGYVTGSQRKLMQNSIFGIRLNYELY